ncbi:MAG: class I SAM-dependent methyltransferase [Arenicella sp.]|nr:class I SAM-dependent methyltransferase [Arenicella sp.]
MDIKSQISIDYLTGKGLELGALNNPLPVDSDKAHVHYADRLPKADALRLFPELEDIADSLIEPDLLIDFDTDTLQCVKDGDYDFVIANHVIEHLVNPLQFLKNVCDHLKPGGLFFLTVPDRDFTFDKHRALTSEQHLFGEYRRGVKKLSNAHIRDFLLYKEPVNDIHPAVRKYFIENGLPLSYYNGNKIPFNPLKRKRLYDFHRSRSIHVHVWNKASFDELLSSANEKLFLGFELVPTHEAAEATGEMIYLLRR